MATQTMSRAVENLLAFLDTPNARVEALGDGAFYKYRGKESEGWIKGSTIEEALSTGLVVIQERNGTRILELVDEDRPLTKEGKPDLRRKENDDIRAARALEQGVITGQNRPLDSDGTADLRRKENFDLRSRGEQSPVPIDPAIRREMTEARESEKASINQGVVNRLSETKTQELDELNIWEALLNWHQTFPTSEVPEIKLTAEYVKNLLQHWKDNNMNIQEAVDSLKSCAQHILEFNKVLMKLK